VCYYCDNLARVGRDPIVPRACPTFLTVCVVTYKIASEHALNQRSTIVTIALLLLFTVLGLGLRLYHLDGQSLWYDEGFSVYLARMDLDDITSRTAADIQPPLYYYLLHGWSIFFGDDEWAVRSLSVLFGVLTIPLMYALALQLFRERWVGLLGALLVAASPLHVWYGQETRMYTLLTFLSVLSSYLLLQAVDARKKWRVVFLWGGYTLVSVAALYTHYFSFFVLAFQAIYLLLVWMNGGFRPTHLILGGLVSGVTTMLLYLPWLPYVVTRYGADTSYWPGQLKIPEVLVDIAILFVGGESVSEAVGILLSIGYGLVLLFCLVSLLAEAAHQAQQTSPGVTYLLPSSSCSYCSIFSSHLP
jgi:hypothetical protein